MKWWDGMLMSYHEAALSDSLLPVDPAWSSHVGDLEDA